MQYRIASGADINHPNGNFFVVGDDDCPVGEGALCILGFPTRRLALIWKNQLEAAHNEQTVAFSVVKE
jgi:hypothetical protein